MSDREFLHMTPSFRSIEPSQTVHYWPWSRTSTSCLAVHCRSCTSSSAVQLKYTLTVYQRPSRLRDYLACTHANTSTLSTVGQPLIQGNHKLHVIEVPFRLRAAHSEAKHCIFYITYIHMCVFGGGDIHAIFQTFVYTLSFLVPQLSYRGSTFYYPSTSETQLWLSILCLLNLPY